MNFIECILIKRELKERETKSTYIDIIRSIDLSMSRINTVSSTYIVVRDIVVIIKVVLIVFRRKL